MSTTGVPAVADSMIPLDELPNRVDELDKSKNFIVHCKLGGRSAKACHFLRGSGFENVRNLHGGIKAWSEQVDPSVPQY